MTLANRGMFYRLTDAMEKSGDAALAYAFHRDEMRRNFLQGQERERLIDEITERVLSRISVSVDATEVFDKIDDLEKRINRLGK